MTKKKEIIVSESFSFQGWNVIEFLKGRKRMIITLVATGIGYILTNEEIIAIVAGGIVEMGFSIGEYYIKKRIK